MKKITLLFVCMTLCNLALFAQDTLVFWDFKAAPYDTLADGGNAWNNLDLVSRDTSWHDKFAYTGGALPNPDKCISSTGWAGGNGTKYYQIGFSSTSFSDLVFYSRQRSSGTGPKTFKVQYRVTGSGVWTDVPGASVITGDNFTSGTLAGISLPAICDNQPDLYLRWVMTSDSSVIGALVQPLGTSRLDEIFILSTTSVGINKLSPANPFMMTPNPCNGSFTLRSNSDAEIKIAIADITGKIIYENISHTSATHITLPGIKPGLYFARVTNLRNREVQTRKLVVK